MISTLIQLVGLVALVVATILSPVIGLAALGVSLIVAGHVADGLTIRRRS